MSSRGAHASSGNLSGLVLAGALAYGGAARAAEKSDPEIVVDPPGENVNLVIQSTELIWRTDPSVLYEINIFGDTTNAPGRKFDLTQWAIIPPNVLTFAGQRLPDNNTGSNVSINPFDFWHLVSMRSNHYGMFNTVDNSPSIVWTVQSYYWLFNDNYREISISGTGPSDVQKGLLATMNFRALSQSDWTKYGRYNFLGFGRFVDSRGSPEGEYCGGQYCLGSNNCENSLCVETLAAGGWPYIIVLPFFRGDVEGGGWDIGGTESGATHNFNAPSFDGDVDLNDFGFIQACASGPTVPFSPGCSGADIDGDGDVDQSDFGFFQEDFNRGPVDPDWFNDPQYNHIVTETEGGYLMNSFPDEWIFPSGLERKVK